VNPLDSAQYVGLTLVAIATAACSPAEDTVEPPASPLAALSTAVLEEEWRIGVLDGPPEFVFGKIGDVGLDGDGRMYVIDPMNHRLRAYDREGSHIASAGREGEGPGEFKASDRLAIGADGAVIVSDRFGRLTTYVLEDSGFLFRGVTSLTFGAFDLCMLPGGILAHGFAVGDTVSLHVIAGANDPGSAFGAFHPGDDLIARETYSWGFVACFPELDRVVYVAQFSPEVRTYSPAGELLWTDTIPDYRQVPSYTRAAMPGYRGFHWTTPEGTHQTISVVSAGGDRVLVQVAMKDTSSTAPRDYQGLDSFLWEVSTGQLLDRSESVPEIVALSQGAAVGVKREPYPQLIKYRAPDWIQ